MSHTVVSNILFSGFMIYLSVFRLIDAQYGPLTISNLKSYNLPNEDDWLGGSESDPFASIYKCKSGGVCDYTHPVRTSIKDNTEDPSWDNIEIPTFYSRTEWNQLEIKFYDHDPTTDNDWLRTVRIDINNQLSCGSFSFAQTPDTLVTLVYEFKCNPLSHYTLVINSITAAKSKNYGLGYLFACKSLYDTDNCQYVGMLIKSTANTEYTYTALGEIYIEHEYNALVFYSGPDASPISVITGINHIYSSTFDLKYFKYAHQASNCDSITIPGRDTGTYKKEDGSNINGHFKC
mmetsp:Transcript_55378/g.49866  ORF Transcript_55378/g.49866 Transcript_55378/m.49866 type:complete len:291 (+) Transcript_55378:106-978(+)